MQDTFNLQVPVYQRLMSLMGNIFNVNKPRNFDGKNSNVTGSFDLCCDVDAQNLRFNEEDPVEAGISTGVRWIHLRM